MARLQMHGSPRQASGLKGRQQQNASCLGVAKEKNQDTFEAEEHQKAVTRAKSLSPIVLGMQDEWLSLPALATASYKTIRSPV